MSSSPPSSGTAETFEARVSTAMVIAASFVFYFFVAGEGQRTDARA